MSASIRRRDRPEQDLVGLEHGTPQALLQRLDRSGSPEAGAPDERRPPPRRRRWRKIHSTTAPGSMRSGSFSSSADCRRDDLEPLAAEVRRTQVVELVVEPRRMDQRHPFDVEGAERGARWSDVPTTGRPQRWDSPSSMARLGVEADGVARARRGVADHVDRSGGEACRRRVQYRRRGQRAQGGRRCRRRSRRGPVVPRREDA